MDYTKLPYKLIYKERRSLEDFVEEHEELEPLIDNMISNTYFSSADGKERVLRCFNTAYYLCTLILLCDKHAEWNFAKYCDIAYCNDNKNKVYQAFTLSLVYIFLTHTYYDIPCKKLIEKLRNYLNSLDHFLQIGDPFLNDYYYSNAFEDLQKDLPEDWLLAEEFKPRTIDEDIFHDVDGIVNWYKLTDYYRREIVETIVNALGKDEYEKHTLIDLIIRDAERFYGSDGPAYTQHAKPLLDDIDHEIYLQYNYEVDQTIEDDNSEQNHYLELKPFDEALIDSLKNDIARLHEEKNQETEKLKTRIAELEKENERLKELLAQQQETSTNETVEEQAQTIQKLKEEITKLKEDKKFSKSEEQICIEINRLKVNYEDMLVRLLKPAFYNIEDDARDYLKRIQGLDNQGVTDVTRQFLQDRKITPSKKGRFIWNILTSAKLYDCVEQNWTAALRKDN